MGALRKRASVLVSVLFLGLLLFVLTLTFLTKQQLRYESTVQLEKVALAQSLAEAGLQDALAKLEKDARFPPPGGDNQTRFTYSEELGSGRYTVAAETDPPGDARFIVIECQGETKQQQAGLRAYLDSDPASSTYWQVVQVDWLSGGL